jgi:hypothetical protein
MRCSKCRTRLVAGARFCHQCGTELPPEIADRVSHWYYEPVFVLLLIFLVFGVFGLPLLWKSPRFSSGQKMGVTLVTVLYTGAILWAFYYLVFVLLIPYYRDALGLF